MDLWIRDQDRTVLTMVNNVFLYEDDTKAIGYSENGKKYCLGEYKNTKRALEVLDEIQEHLDYLNIGKINRTDEKGFRVSTIYNMPKE